MSNDSAPTDATPCLAPEPGTITNTMYTIERSIYFCFFFSALLASSLVRMILGCGVA